MSILVKYLSSFFQLIHHGIGTVLTDPNVSYGIAIILFTAIIRIILLPLTIKQQKSTIAMQEIQPEIKKLQKKYKNEPEKLNAEMMKLYKEKKANPLSGCLPMIIQMPILFGLFYVFNSLPGITGVKFLWMPNLGAKDPYYILPILSAATTYYQSLIMTPSNGDEAQIKQTKTMNIGMSIFFGIMSLQFKAALVLYYVTNNLFQIGQTWVFNSVRKKQEQ